MIAIKVADTIIFEVYEMKIKSFSTTPNFFDSINFDDGKNIHFIAGYCSKIVLDLLRLLTLDYDDQERVTTLKFDEEFLIHGDVCHDGDVYNVTNRCYVDEKGEIDGYMGANKGEKYVVQDTLDYMALCTGNTLGEENAAAIKSAAHPVVKPKFVYDFYDEANPQDLAYFLSQYAESDRQVFVALPDKFLTEDFEEKVQVHRLPTELYSKIYLLKA
ncbi:MAG: hypothetical protein IKC54_00145 [Clostridia bacterium]|nr:hypothetical protein [Clostridia bacterium]